MRVNLIWHTYKARIWYLAERVFFAQNFLTIVFYRFQQESALETIPFHPLLNNQKFHTACSTIEQYFVIFCRLLKKITLIKVDAKRRQNKM